MKTLDQLRKQTEKQSDGPKRDFLSIADGQSFKIRFLQELAEDGTGFKEEAGTASIVPVHKNPTNFKRRLACTKESEEFGFKCWACEQVGENKKWYSNPRLFINVAVFDNDSKTWNVQVLEQGFGKSHIANEMIEYASVYGSIVDREYKISRKGSGMNDTAYSLIPLAEGKPSKEVSELVLHSFDGLAREIAYEEQENYYFDIQSADPAKGWK